MSLVQKNCRVMKMTWNPRMKNSKVRRQRATMSLFFADLDEQSRPSTTIQFISDEQIAAVVVQGPWDVSTIIDITCIL